MQTYFARQPILDQNMRLYAYELLYRGGPHADSSGIPLDEDKATAAVIEAFQVRGVKKITGGKKAFVNFSQTLLLNGVAAYFPPDSMVIEILENIEPTPEIIAELRRLKLLGYTLALDDFVYRPSLKPLVELADIIKIDFLDGVFSMRNFYAICAHINLSKCLLLAEKVENKRIYDKASELGCQLFQGYFFAKPSNMSEQTIGVMRINTLRLMAEVSRSEIDFDRVAEIIKQDVGLAYKVLKLVNSAYFALKREILDIKQAVIFLGHNELKKWVSFVALTNMRGTKPPELTEMSMVRARFCEMTAMRICQEENREAFFLTGLFSLLDVIMDAEMKAILEDVLLPEVARAALMGEHGSARSALNLISALEQGNWNEVLRLCGELGVDSGDMSEQYADSLQWSSELHIEEDM